MGIDAFTIFAFAFFIFVMIWGVNLETLRNNREERIERDRHARDMAEKREFGYAPVQQARENQQSLRRFIK